MVRLAELLADLTSLKTIDPSDALALVNLQGGSGGGGQPNDADFVRAREFLELRSEQRGHEDLIAKRREVQGVVERFSRKAGSGYSR